MRVDVPLIFGAFEKELWFGLVVTCALLAPLWLCDALLPGRIRARLAQRYGTLSG